MRLVANTQVQRPPATQSSAVTGSNGSDENAAMANAKHEPSASQIPTRRNSIARDET
jgi:hypothetical protein